MFTGFPEETFQFFLDLRFHNDKTYFEQHRARYERDVKAVFHAFIEELAPAMQKIDPQMEVRPYKCLSRIHRDTRFTKDKSPFRDHLWLCFRRAAEQKEGSINFYFELGPGKLGWGLGIWSENRPMLDVLRRRIVADPEGVAKVINRCKLKKNDLEVQGSIWKRMEIPPEVPLGLRGWYAMREVYVCRAHPDMGIVGTADIAEVVRKDFKTMAPIYRLLRGAYDEAAEESENV